MARNKHSTVRHKNMKVDEATWQIITNRMIDENCDWATAVKGLIFDGAKATRPRPVVAQVARPEALDEFKKELAEWRWDFREIKSRIGARVRDPRDVELNARIKRWNDQADDLEKKISGLWKRADALGKTMTSLNEADCEQLQKAYLFAIELVGMSRLRLSNPDATEEAKARARDDLNTFQSLERALEILGV